MTYSMVCADGHEPETLTVDAENEEKAMEMMMEKAKMHFAEKHPGMNMSDEDLMNHIKTTWTTMPAAA